MSNTDKKEKKKDGRPRVHDREELTSLITEWAKKDSSLNLCEFCAINSIAPSVLVRMTKDDENLCQAYELAKAIIATRREKKLSTGELHVKAYDLNASTYDFFLQQEKRAQAEFEAQLKKESTPTLTDDQIKPFVELMEAIQSSQRKIADISTSIDSKS